MFDPFSSFRRVFARELAQQEQRIVDLVLSAPGIVTSMALRQARESAAEFVEETLTFIGKLSHRAADEYLRISGGPFARPLTARERRLVIEAHGTRIQPDMVRIVPGWGIPTIAFIAFQNGNPAITTGNMVFVRSDLSWLHTDELPKTIGGLELLLHECTHVVQYATLGYPSFLRRYAVEMRRYGDAKRLYDYQTRHLPFAGETLEGQAQIVGDFAGARLGFTPDSGETATQLRARLRDTGVYGN